MVTKLVQFSDEAYQRLKNRKRPGESFSDVIVRLTGGPGDLRRLKGLMSKDEARRARAMLRKVDGMERRDVARWQSSTRRS